MSNDLLLRKGKIWIHPSSRFKLLLLKEFHETPIGGHAGVLKTLKRLSANFYWDSMRKDIKEFVDSCIVCQQTKYSTRKPTGLLQPLPIPSNVWEDISLDFITGLPNSGGYTALLVVVDRFSKYVHLGALPSNFTAYKVADLFVHMVCKLHGLPKSIISDRDPLFISKFWTDLFKFSDTLLRMSSSYHPQTDGQTEVTNRTIEQYLRSFVHHKPAAWHKYLPWAEYHYNTAHHTSVGISPFQVVYGKPPPTLPLYVAGSSSVAATDDTLRDREEILTCLRKNLSKAQARMKLNADKKRREETFDVDSFVHVKLQPYRQTSLSGARYNKLSKRYYGPYRVLERIGLVAYKLELPSYSKIHNVFHCSLLKPYHGPLPPPASFLPLESVAHHPVISPLTILDSRVTSAEGQQHYQALVQWNGLAPDDTSWENWSELQAAYNLEDKVVFEGVGIDTPSAIKGPTSDIHGVVNKPDGPNIQPNSSRPQRTSRMPARYKDHVLSK